MSITIIQQAKLYIGIHELVALSKLPGPIAASQQTEAETLAESLRQMASREISPAEVQAFLIIFAHLNWPEADFLRERLRDLPPPAEADSARLDALIRKLYLDQKPLAAPELVEINKRRKFLGDLATLYTYRINADSRAEILDKQIKSESLHFAVILITVVGAFTLGGIVGIFLLAGFTRQALLGRITRGMSDSRVPPHLGFEVMALYLSLMYLLPLLLPPLPALGPLASAWTLPLAFFAAAAYPLTQYAARNLRVHREPLRLDLGLTAGKSSAMEFACGATGYLAFIPIMGLMIMINLLLIRLTGLDPQDGTHPVIPLLGEDGATPFVRALVVLLALVLAPVTEEIIFRGYFYRFLRSRYDMANSVFISSALFAGIHPQGMMGFFPLMAIGATLAVLREWRGSLLAPVVMHVMVNGITLGLVMLMF